MSGVGFSVESRRYFDTVARPLPSTNCLAKSRDFSAVKTSLEIRLTAIGTFSFVRYRMEFRVRCTMSALAISIEICSLSLSYAGWLKGMLKILKM